MDKSHAGCWVIAVALSFAGCGSSDGSATETEDTTAEASAGDESAPAPLGEEEESAGDEPAEDGSRCLPVAQCASFANQRCTLVDASGQATGEDGEPMAGARVREACPGERGVDGSVTECFDYVESERSCRRPPDIRAPEWPCARTEAGGCDVQMF